MKLRTYLGLIVIITTNRKLTLWGLLPSRTEDNLVYAVTCYMCLCDCAYSVVSKNMKTIVKNSYFFSCKENCIGSEVTSEFFVPSNFTRFTGKAVWNLIRNNLTLTVGSVKACEKFHFTVSSRTKPSDRSHFLLPTAPLFLPPQPFKNSRCSFKLNELLRSVFSRSL